MRRSRILVFILVLAFLFTAVNISIAYAAPAAPTALKAAVQGSSSVKLTWNAVSGAAKYQVYRGTSASSMALAATVTTATWASTALTSSTKYYFKVRALTSTGAAGAFSATVSATTTAGIAAPTGLKATSASGSQINLTWSAVSGATGYTVYRATSSTGAYSKIATVTARAYNNTGLAANTVYYYKVRAVNAKGEGKYSAAVSARTRPAVPTGLKAAAPNTTSIKLTWNAVAGATKYLVYRCATATGTFAKIGEATTATYTNTGLAVNTTYYYKVSAVNAAGEGGKTAALSGRTRSTAPTGLKATAPGPGSIKLTWTAISGVTKYVVYRSASSTGTFTKVGEATAAAFTNTGLAGNTVYYYKISAVNAGGESAQSAVASARTRPAAPTGLKAEAPSTTSIKLTWTAVSGATKYIVYRSASSTGTFAKVGEATTATFTNTGLAANTAYYYKVSAVSASGEGAQCGAVSGRTRPAAPTGLIASGLNSTSIKLTWTAVAGATKYVVYRSASSTGTFAKLGEATTATFTNTGLAAETTYNYKVSAVNAGGEGAQSTVASAKTKSSTPVLPAPTNLHTTTYNFQSVWLNFDQVQNAVTYRIYYSKTASPDIAAYEYFDYASNDFRVIGLDAATTYYFRVAAVASGGAVGTPTGFMSGTTAGAPGTPPQPKFYLYNIEQVDSKYRMNFCRGTNPIYPTINDPTFNFYVGSSSSSMTFDSDCDLSGYFYLDVNPGQALYYGFTANYGPYSSSRQLIQVAALGDPINVQTSTISSTVTLSWNAVPAAGRYNIYTCVGSPDITTSWPEFRDATLPSGNLVFKGYTSSTSITLTGMNYGSLYYIVVPATSSGVEGWYCGYAIGTVFH